MEIIPLCTRYVAFLRALYLLHQNNHWCSKGEAFFAHHLLFERIYGTAQENADAAAEKIVGTFGVEALDLGKQAESIADLLKTFSEESNLVLRSLKAEGSFQEFSNDFFHQLDENNKLSLGMNDLIMGIANERESAIYLLKQTTGNENMTKLSQLNKLANKFQQTLAQDMNGQLPAPEAPPQGVSSLNIASVGDQVKGDLKSLLGLKENLDFSTLKLVTDPNTNKPSIAWGLQVPANVVKEYNEAVARQRQSNPNFSVSRYIVSLFNKYAPDTTVMPAQPISVG